MSAIVLSVAALVAAAFDLWARRVPNWLNGIILVVGLGWQLATGGAWGLLYGVGGAATALSLLIVPFELRWVGGGDVKLAAAMGAWLSPWTALVAVLLGVVGGGIIALVMALRIAGLLASVARTLKLSVMTMSAPAVPPRAGRLLVPLALSLGIAAVLVHTHVVVI